jgi:hypothetical protein
MTTSEKHGGDWNGVLSFEDYDKDPDMWIGLFMPMNEFIEQERREAELERLEEG